MELEQSVLDALCYVLMVMLFMILMLKLLLEELWSGLTFFFCLNSVYLLCNVNSSYNQFGVGSVSACLVMQWWILILNYEARTPDTPTQILIWEIDINHRRCVSVVSDMHVWHRDTPDPRSVVLHRFWMDWFCKIES